MSYKRILTVQDISCLGQCSMTVALPILSAWGHETCILPTAILSTHTGGFSTPAVHHLGGALTRTREHWKREGITFDAVYTGYLGSEDAVWEVLELKEMLAPGGELIVDPAMADHGRVYSGLNQACVDAMLQLCQRADILLPNVTEAAMLAGVEFQKNLTEEYVTILAEGIPCKKTVITGIGYGDAETGVFVRNEDSCAHYFHEKIGKSYHGTGDIFASCLTGAYLDGMTLLEAAKTSADFTYACILNTWKDPAHEYGVKFETSLPQIYKYKSHL